MADLLNQYTARLGTNLSLTVLRARVEQAILNKALEIKSEDPTTPERQAWAAEAEANTLATTNTIMGYMVQNATIQLKGGEATNGDVEYVLIGIIDGRANDAAAPGLYPPA